MIDVLQAIIEWQRRYGGVTRSPVMHELSLGTWWIHWASVVEWLAAIVLIQRRAPGLRFAGVSLFSLAMIPALISAMAACTWHLYDNAQSLRWLVTLQAFTTLIGNGCLALVAASWRGTPADSTESSMEKH